jgi:hypothetical protein
MERITNGSNRSASRSLGLSPLPKIGHRSLKVGLVADRRCLRSDEPDAVGLDEDPVSPGRTVDAAKLFYMTAE